MSKDIQNCFTAPTHWDERHPPKDAKKGYVARITGREAGPKKYAREFLGGTFTAVQGDEGLYERQIGQQKGGATRYYHVVLWDGVNNRMLASRDCEDLVPQIAARLDAGEVIHDIVEATDIEERDEKCPTFTAVLRTTPRDPKAEALAAIRRLMAEHGITAADL